MFFFLTKTYVVGTQNNRSFEYPNIILKVMDKKTFTILRSKSLLILTNVRVPAHSISIHNICFDLEIIKIITFSYLTLTLHLFADLCLEIKKNNSWLCIVKCVYNTVKHVIKVDI